MTDIVKRLLALARAEHDDLAIADEAADEIERLREALKGAQVWREIEIAPHWGTAALARSMRGAQNG